ncbi:MAG: carbamoyltransferase [bacterium]|nr:carbamoyltransferase [bacterium]
MPTRILGLSAFYHDSAACLVIDGKIIAAAQEERFSRVKFDADFPRRAIGYCLEEGELSSASDLDAVVFYDKPILKFQRLLETYLAYAPNGLPSFLEAMPLWMRKKLRTRDLLRRELDFEGPIYFTEHHESHAASAFFPSPFEEAAIVTADGVGERATASIGVGRGNQISILEELHFPHSLGLLYSAFTTFCGFKVNSGEYKLMGLAPFGEPKYVDRILNDLVHLYDDGSLRLNLKYFAYCTSLRMTNRLFAELFDGPARLPEAAITQREMDLARSVQAVTERAMLGMARRARAMTESPNLVLAGGVALNCVANGRIVREGSFDNVWIQPAAGDAGGALGAALFVHHQLNGGGRKADGQNDRQQGSLLGPAFSNREVAAFLTERGLDPAELDDEGLVDRVAALLAEGKVAGWFQGRMEFGPRALGARSILADPRRAETQTVLNRKIKFRESFRPFAPAVLVEHAPQYFGLDGDSPYMLLVCGVDRRQRRSVPENAEQDAAGLERLRQVRSTIPAVTHVDGSARVQTVGAEAQPRFRALLERFHERTGCPVLVNTSFNVRGEPIVRTPAEAYRCFERTDMDFLVLGSFIVEKDPTRIARTRWTARQSSEATSGSAPDTVERDARRFGLILAVVLIVLAVLAGVFAHPGRARVAGAAAAVVALASLLKLPVWTLVYRLWMRLAERIGKVVSGAALVLSFFLVVTPFGLFRRMVGRPSLDTRWPGQRQTNWRPKQTPAEGDDRYRRQY